jgi:hypothetical protein
MDAAALVEKWREVVNSPYLRDLPFKLELNENGKVEFAMSPATNRHSWWQFRIGVMLEQRLGGEVGSVPDVDFILKPQIHIG